MKLPTSSKAQGLCRMLVMLVFVSVTSAVRADENFTPNTLPPTVWTLDNVKLIGGHRPRVLGAPRIASAATGGPALLFNGKSDGLILPVNPLRGLSKFTIEILFRPDADGLPAQRFVHIQDDRDSRVMIETRLISSLSWSLDTFMLSGESGRPLLDRTRRHPTGRWTWVALVYDGKTMSDYVNGVKELEGPVNFAPMADGRMSLGVRLNRVYWFKGTLKEVRFSPLPLKPADLRRISEK
ncbi:MAG TPA: LamG domain-containing protein [Verrucomicrobiae bacterium]|nr:LamG domain-containing protein [Verrucomicrobiae bacterium]